MIPPAQWIRLQKPKSVKEWQRAFRGTTKIIIAQRISSVAHADKIVILEDGKIHATGTHEELLKNNLIYQEIYQSQQEGADL